MSGSDRLERHSLLLLAATAVGHIGNYAYHAIAGRMLSDVEYGLLMALFGGVNLLLLPMGALTPALARACAPFAAGDSLRALVRRWSILLAAAGGLLFLAGAALTPILRLRLGSERSAPFLLAAAIPALNLGLVLTGACLQGLQQFAPLALRGALLFGGRAALIGLCLGLGFRAAGWALLAHLLAMLLALGYSALALRRSLPPESGAPASPPAPILREALAALPILLAFAALLSLDVPLARRYFDPHTAGAFARAATLGRMILWLPLPVAIALFPKLARGGSATPAQRKVFRRALFYSLALTAAALAAAWGFAPLGLRVLYGIENPDAALIAWLRGMGLAVAPLALLHLLLQAELARGRVRRLLPICLCAAAYAGAVALHHPDPEALLRTLGIANSAALLLCAPVLNELWSRAAPADVREPLPPGRTP